MKYLFFSAAMLALTGASAREDNTFTCIHRLIEITSRIIDVDNYLIDSNFPKGSPEWNHYIDKRSTLSLVEMRISAECSK